MPTQCFVLGFFFSSYCSHLRQSLDLCCTALSPGTKAGVEASKPRKQLLTLKSNLGREALVKMGGCTISLRLDTKIVGIRKCYSKNRGRGCDVDELWMCLLDGEKADAPQTASRLSCDFLGRKKEQNNKFWMYKRYQEESIPSYPRQ